MPVSMSVFEENVQMVSVQVLEQYLSPIADQLDKLRKAQPGIIVVVNKPSPFALKAFKVLGLRPKVGATTAWGLSCADAVRAFGHDKVTAMWAATPPAENCMKILFFQGDGSVLLHRFPELPAGSRLLRTADFDEVH